MCQYCRWSSTKCTVICFERSLVLAHSYTCATRPSWSIFTVSPASIPSARPLWPGGGCARIRTELSASSHPCMSHSHPSSLVLLFKYQGCVFITFSLSLGYVGRVTTGTRHVSWLMRRCWRPLPCSLTLAISMTPPIRWSPDWDVCATHTAASGWHRRSWMNSTSGHWKVSMTALASFSFNWMFTP